MTTPPGSSTTEGLNYAEANKPATPILARFGATRKVKGTDHWAVTTRAYTYLGLLEQSPSVGYGDLAGWGLDLGTFWTDYEDARLAAPQGTLDIGLWFDTNLGINVNTRFPAADFRSDCAAYLTARAMTADHSRPLEDIVRELSAAIEDDPGYLAKKFYEIRFRTDAAVVAAAKEVFTMGFPSDGPLNYFLQGRRRPGEPTTVSSPTAAVLATELNAVGNAFLRALQRAMNWTAR